MSILLLSITWRPGLHVLLHLRGRTTKVQQAHYIDGTTLMTSCKAVVLTGTISGFQHASCAADYGRSRRLLAKIPYTIGYLLEGFSARPRGFRACTLLRGVWRELSERFMTWTTRQPQLARTSIRKESPEGLLQAANRPEHERDE